MESQELVTVYTVANPIEAEIIKNALRDEGLAAELENEHQAAEAGLMGLEIKIQVPAGHAAAARRFVEEHERNRAARRESEEEPT